MRIDLPLCDLKSCVHCQDHNCTNKQLYETCTYSKSNRILEEISSFFSQFDVTCQEDIHQCDSVLEELPDFTTRLLKIMMEEPPC